MYKILPIREIKNKTKDLFSFVKKKRDNIKLTPSQIYPYSHDLIKRPWFSHPYCDDMMIMLKGERHIDIYDKTKRELDHIYITPFEVYKNNELLHNEMCAIYFKSGCYFRIINGNDFSESVNYLYNYKFVKQNNYGVYNVDIKNNKSYYLRSEFISKYK